MIYHLTVICEWSRNMRVNAAQWHETLHRYLSARSEMETYETEKKREEEEVRTVPDEGMNHCISMTF